VIPSINCFSLFLIVVIKLCELCKTDINIQWKCVECNKFICDRCKNIHLNVQTSIQHQIIDIN
jgi:hypothetical protein